MKPITLFYFVLSIIVLLAASCQDETLIVEPTVIVEVTAVSPTETPSPHPTPSATATIQPPTATTTPLPTLTQTPSPTFTASPTVEPTPTATFPVGLEYFIQGTQYVVDAANEAVIIPTQSFYNSPDEAITLVMTPDAAYYVDVAAGEAFWQVNESNTYLPLNIDNFGEGIVSDWWTAEPDWVLLSLALGGSWTESDLPQSGIVRVDGAGYQFLGGAAAANPAGEWVAYQGSYSTRLEPSEKKGIWLYNIKTREDFQIDFVSYGLPEVINDCVGKPTWSPNGRYLTFFIFSNCGLAHSGTMHIDFWGSKATLIPIRYGGPEGPPSAPFWNASGEYLLVQGNGDVHGIWILKEDTTFFNILEMGLYGRWINKTQLIYSDYETGKWMLFDVETNKNMPIILPANAYIDQSP